MGKYRTGIILILFTVVTLAIVASVSPISHFRTNNEAAVSKSLENAKTKKATNQKKVTDAYKRLVAEVQSGLKQKGVSPDWRDGEMKKLETLRKQGLDAKKVAEVRTLIARLKVGGERLGANPSDAATGKCVSQIAPVFTHHFAEIDMIAAFAPIGGIGGGSPGRSYVGVKPGMETAVFAPMDAILQKIVYVDRGAGHGEYGLYFKASCEVEFLLDHIDRVSDNIKKYAPTKLANSTQIGEGAEPDLPIKGGELLGYTDGTELARTFDFLVMNYGKKNSFLKPARWEWEQALYGSCPYDYYTPALRPVYYERLGKPSDRGLIKATDCGNPSHDVAGTASGGWFKGASTDKRGEYLAIARDHYSGVQIAYRKDGQAFANARDVQTGNPYFNLTDTAPSKYPADMKPGDSACYSDGKQWGFIKLLSATELSFAKGIGACPPEFPASGTETWIR